MRLNQRLNQLLNQLLNQRLNQLLRQGQIWPHKQLRPPKQHHQLKPSQVAQQESACRNAPGVVVPDSVTRSALHRANLRAARRAARAFRQQVARWSATSHPATFFVRHLLARAHLAQDAQCSVANQHATQSAPRIPTLASRSARNQCVTGSAQRRLIAPSQHAHWSVSPRRLAVPRRPPLRRSRPCRRSRMAT